MRTPADRERRKRPNIGEIARRAGVARSTVSYALSGKRTISPAKRSEILRLVEQLGYRPHASARALAEGKTRTVGLVIPPPSHRLLDTQLAFVAALSELCSSAGLDLLVSLSSDEHERSFQSMLAGDRVDGVLMMEVRLRDERIVALERSGVPYVLFGRPADPDPLFWVDSDYDGMVERCVDHLADLGHRRIALLNRPRELLTSGYGPALRAVEGLRRGAARRGLQVRAFSCTDNAAGGDAAMREILAARPRITAAVTINEVALAGVSRALDRAGVRLPQDFSLVGVVNDRWAEDFHPPLTSAVVSPSEMVQMAFKMLLQRISDPRSPPQHFLQSSGITERATTGPAPRNAGRG